MGLMKSGDGGVPVVVELSFSLASSTPPVPIL